MFWYENVIQPTHYNGFNYLSKLELKLIHVSKTDLKDHLTTRININTYMKKTASMIKVWEKFNDATVVITLNPC